MGLDRKNSPPPSNAPKRPSIGNYQKGRRRNAEHGSSKGSASASTPQAAAARTRPAAHQYTGGAHGTASVRQENPWSVPAPLYAVYRWVVLDLRDESDDFDATLRKLFVSAGIPLAVFPSAFALYLIGDLSSPPPETDPTGGRKTGAAVALVSMLLFPLVWLISYARVRITKATPDLLMDTWLLLSLCGIAGVSVSLVEYPSQLLVNSLALMAMFCRTRLLPMHLLLCTGVYSIGLANSAVAGLGRSNEDSLAAVPGPFWTTLLERLWFQGSCFVITMSIALAVIMQVRRHAHAMVRASMTAFVAKIVADQLATYDTEGAAETLEVFQGSDTDHALLESFSGVIDNLEQYRPHLPNWILQGHAEARRVAAQNAATAMDDFVKHGEETKRFLSSSSAGGVVGKRKGDGRGSAVVLIDGEDHSRTSSAQRKSRPGSRSESAASGPAHSASTEVDLDLAVDLRLESSESSTASDSDDDGDPEAGLEGTASIDGRQQYPYQAVAASKRSDTARIHNPTSPTDGPFSSRSQLSHVFHSAVTRGFTGRATLAMLHVDLNVNGDAVAAAIDPILEGVVDRIYDVAATSQAAIHSLVGDTVLVSWNAVQRVAAGEVKATKFLAQLATWVGHSDARISGCALTDTIRCNVYGSSGGHQGFASHVPWKSTLYAVSLYAKKQRALLTDEAAHLNGSMDAEMFPCDVLRVPMWRPPVSTMSGTVSSVLGLPSAASPSNDTLPTRVMRRGSTSILTGGGGGPMQPNSAQKRKLSQTVSSRVQLVPRSSSAATWAVTVDDEAPYGLRQMRVYEVLREHHLVSHEPSTTGNEDTDSQHSRGSRGTNRSGHISGRTHGDRVALRDSTSTTVGGGDEWMYLMQRRARRSHSKLQHTGSSNSLLGMSGGGAVASGIFVPGLSNGTGGGVEDASPAADTLGGDPIEGALVLGMEGRYHDALELLADYLQTVAGVSSDAPAAADVGFGHKASVSGLGEGSVSYHSAPPPPQETEEPASAAFAPHKSDRQQSLSTSLPIEDVVDTVTKAIAVGGARGSPTGYGSVPGTTAASPMGGADQHGMHPVVSPITDLLRAAAPPPVRRLVEKLERMQRAGAPASEFPTHCWLMVGGGWSFPLQSPPATR